MSSATYNLFPEIHPYQSSLLKVSNLHQIYYEQCGNPQGQPVVFLHGGPGSGCNPAQRRFFDPAHYRIILLDQRGCGRSLPLGETLDNTTDDLLADIDALRMHLQIDRWLVFGGSWGSTLAITYALSYPSNTQGLILRGIFLSRQSELEWFLKDINHFYPDTLNILKSFLPEDERADLLNSFSNRIFSTDKSISIPAAIVWNNFESSIMSLKPPTGSSNPVSDEVQLARARVQIHYIKNSCFVGQRDILTEVTRIAHIPTTIVQGRYDMVCPPVTAWQLKQAMPHAELFMIDDAGHSAMEPGTMSALIAATEKYKSLI